MMKGISLAQINERCVITKKNDEYMRIVLKPGQKGLTTYKDKPIQKQGGSNTEDIVFSRTMKCGTR
jgi:hypothetical protein